MRKDVKNWLEQSKKDYENAEKNFELNEYYLTAFLVQQSVEKALKGYYIQKKKKFVGKTHSLVYIGSELKMPENLLTELRKINPDFIYTRYPDMEGVPPYKAYDKKIAKERLKSGNKVLKWIKKQINQ